MRQKVWSTSRILRGSGPPPIAGHPPIGMRRLKAAFAAHVANPAVNRANLRQPDSDRRPLPMGEIVEQTRAPDAALPPDASCNPGLEFASAKSGPVRQNLPPAAEIHIGRVNRLRAT